MTISYHVSSLEYIKSRSKLEKEYIFYHQTAPKWMELSRRYNLKQTICSAHVQGKFMIRRAQENMMKARSGASKMAQELRVLATRPGQ